MMKKIPVVFLFHPIVIIDIGGDKGLDFVLPPVFKLLHTYKNQEMTYVE